MARGVPTSRKVREIIIQLYAKGKSLNKIAEELSMSKSTVGDIVKRYGETSTIDVLGKSPGRPQIINERARRCLTRICKKKRRSNLREINALWNEETGLKVSRECCRKWLHKSGYNFYKVIKK